METFISYMEERIASYNANHYQYKTLEKSAQTVKMAEAYNACAACTWNLKEELESVLKEYKKQTSNQ